MMSYFFMLTLHVSTCLFPRLICFGFIFEQTSVFIYTYVQLPVQVVYPSPYQTVLICEKTREQTIAKVYVTI
jgi:hypothetical protein